MYVIVIRGSESNAIQSAFIELGAIKSKFQQNKTKWCGKNS